ncbi:hypothetical protein NMY22_g9347 [Coprinellus aureogranulatus]|nr:hypothetical protein NMY22_g9347 [Coprinellus aureogranulatus]
MFTVGIRVPTPLLAFLPWPASTVRVGFKAALFYVHRPTRESLEEEGSAPQPTVVELLLVLFPDLNMTGPSNSRAHSSGFFSAIGTVSASGDPVGRGLDHVGEDAGQYIAPDDAMYHGTATKTPRIQTSRPVPDLGEPLICLPRAPLPLPMKLKPLLPSRPSKPETTRKKQTAGKNIASYQVTPSSSMIPEVHIMPHQQPLLSIDALPLCLRRNCPCRGPCSEIHLFKPASPLPSPIPLALHRRPSSSQTRHTRGPQRRRLPNPMSGDRPEASTARKKVNVPHHSPSAFAAAQVSSNHEPATVQTEVEAVVPASRTTPRSPPSFFSLEDTLTELSQIQQFQDMLKRLHGNGGGPYGVDVYTQPAGLVTDTDVDHPMQPEDEQVEDGEVQQEDARYEQYDAEIEPSLGVAQFDEDEAGHGDVAPNGDDDGISCLQRKVTVNGTTSSTEKNSPSLKETDAAADMDQYDVTGLFISGGDVDYETDTELEKDANPPYPEEPAEVPPPTPSTPRRNAAGTSSATARRQPAAFDCSHQCVLPSAHVLIAGPMCNLPTSASLLRKSSSKCAAIPPASELNSRTSYRAILNFGRCTTPNHAYRYLADLQYSRLSSCFCVDPRLESATFSTWSIYDGEGRYSDCAEIDLSQYEYRITQQRLGRRKSSSTPREPRKQVALRYAHPRGSRSPWALPSLHSGGQAAICVSPVMVTEPFVTALTTKGLVHQLVFGLFHIPHPAVGTYGRLHLCTRTEDKAAAALSAEGGKKSKASLSTFPGSCAKSEQYSRRMEDLIPVYDCRDFDVDLNRHLLDLDRFPR